MGEEATPSVPPGMNSDALSPTPKPAPRYGIVYVLVFLIGAAAGIAGYVLYSRTAGRTINSFEECVKANGGQQNLMYPPTCTTRDGRRFILEDSMPDTNPDPGTDLMENRGQASPAGQPTCRPRPACLDMDPPCLMPETEDMCPN